MGKHTWFCEFEGCDDKATETRSGVALCNLHAALTDSVELASRRHPSMRWQQLRLQLEEPPREHPEQAETGAGEVVNLDDRRKP